MLNGCHGVEETLPLGAYKQRQDIVEARRGGGGCREEGKENHMSCRRQGNIPGSRILGRSRLDQPQEVMPSREGNVSEPGALRDSQGRGRKGTVCFHVPCSPGQPRNVCALSLGG